MSVARLRAAFIALGVVLLGVQFVLVRTALSRIEEQRYLRHEVVAERILDEIERELTLHLSLESTRPSEVYDTPKTAPSTWSPFIVGYFTVDDGYRVVSDAQLDPKRVARVRGVLETLWPDAAVARELPKRPPVAQPPDARTRDDFGPLPVEKPAELDEPTSPADVVRRLKRPVQRRPRPEQDSLSDPFL